MTKFSSFIVVLLLLSVSFTAHAEGYPRGDVDRDGSVNISDVTCLIDNLLKGVAYGDVDQDGVVGIADVTSLIDYLLKGTWPDDPVTPPDDHEWVDLGLPSGTLWATMNVGATAPEEYGDYFAWGETAPKEVYNRNTYMWCNGSSDTLTKYCTDSTYGTVDNKTELDLEDDAAYVNWGPAWRMPTLEQLQELIDKCTWTWTTKNGVNGQLGIGPSGNTIFLPAAGERWHGSLDSAGSSGIYWSRTLRSDYVYDAYCLYFYSFSVYLHGGYYERSCGHAVRAMRVSQN